MNYFDNHDNESDTESFGGVRATAATVIASTSTAAILVIVSAAV
jgi:hypothetical protein